MNSPAISVAAAMVLAVGGLGAMLGGCSSGPSRPVLADSVVPGTATGAANAGELDFLDALASRPLVCHDEAIHAALLLGNGVSRREHLNSALSLAKQVGYVDGGFDRSPREAATVGEVSQMVLVIMESDGSTSGRRVPQEQALVRLAGRGLVPANLHAHQGLTGAQLLTILGGARTAMGDRPRMNVLPARPATETARDTNEGARSVVVSAESSASGSAGDPLPPSATDPALERAAAATPAPAVPPARPAAAAPSPAPAEVVQAPPAGPAPVPPPPARVWVPGKPLKKPGS